MAGWATASTTRTKCRKVRTDRTGRKVVLLAGKTVLVTGVGVGLGRECASSALRDGANVVLAARRGDELASVAAELDPGGARTAHRATDITDGDACAALVAMAQERFGSVDALIQVAAFERAWGGLYDLNLDDWRAAFDTNVLGALTLLRPVAKAMKEGGGGSVVFIGSQSMFKPAMAQAGYAASKGALLTAIYYLADELGPDNIRCNMVIPSWMWGPNVQLYVSGTARHQGRSEEEVLGELVGETLLQRGGAKILEDVYAAGMPQKP
jgi:NAD(P)-dependent dehydrogenase (short-subunit alcohol dehydrogenase family)